MTLRQLPEARQALRGRAFFRCRGAAEAVLTFEPEVMPVNPNKKCGIRILMLTRAEQMRCSGAGAGIHGLESVLITRTKSAESAF